MTWDGAGKFAFLNYKDAATKKGLFVMPVQDNGLPKLPPGGFPDKEELVKANLTAIPHSLESAASPSVYAYTMQNIRRNLYRVPLQ
jgi:hypothetical protein